MQSRLNPYISFKGATREAMEFYRSVFGGELRFNTFKEYQASGDPSEDDLIMHSILEADNGFTLMAADSPERRPYVKGNDITISLSGDNEAELRGYFVKLSVGGTVLMPLEKAMWGDVFGMLTDKFGIGWLVNVTG